MKRILLLILAALPAFAVGTVQQSIQPLGSTGNYALTFYWTGDAVTGTVPVTAAQLGIASGIAQGMRILQVETAPGTPAPTNNYSVKLIDAASGDVMSGAMAALSNVNTQFFAALSTTPPIIGTFSLSISGQSVAGAKGQVIVYFGPTTLVNATNGAAGPTGPAGPAGPQGPAGGGLPSATYNFTPQFPAGTLSGGGGGQAVTLTPCPLGVNGTDTQHYLYLDTVGTPEAVLITGGTCTSGLTTGTVIFSPVNNHGSGYRIQSASAGMTEAINSLPATGGIVAVACGVNTIYQVVSIGNGSGTTDSTVQNIRLIGCGHGADEFLVPNTAATDIVWSGPAGGTMISVLGPIRASGISSVRLNGSNTAAKLLQVYASDGGDFRYNNYVNVQANGTILGLEAGAGFNANTVLNDFSDSKMRAMTSGASCIKIGMVPPNFNSGNFVNIFHGIWCNYQNDTASSIGLELGWADNNSFTAVEFNSNTRPGSGFAIKRDRQAGTFNFLPTENTFRHVGLCGQSNCNAITGDAGVGVGDFFWDLQELESGSLPGAGSMKGLRGWADDGDMFDKGTIGRMGAQDYFTIYSMLAAPVFRIIGFAGTLGAGTIQTTGTAVAGTGTHFLTQPGIGGTILVNGNEFRTLVAVANDTTATMNVAFTDDQPALTGYFYSLGANINIYADGNAEFATYFGNLNLQIPNGSGGLTTALTAQKATGNVGVFGSLTGVGPNTTFSNAGGNTISVGSMVNGQIIRSAGGAQTDTTDTAANIVAALPNCQVGTQFQMWVYNSSGGLHTLGLGTNVTIAAGFTSTLTTTNANAHSFLFRVTNCGTPALSIYSQGQAAF